MIVPFAPIGGSSIGALAARFDIVLSGIAAQVPVLEITNTSDPARNPDFKVGDT